MKCGICPVRAPGTCLGERVRRLCVLVRRGEPGIAGRLVELAADPAARRAAKPRVPLGVPHCQPCVEQQRKATDKGPARRYSG